MKPKKLTLSERILLEAEEKKKKSPIGRFGKVFRIVFHVILFIIVWRITPYAFGEWDFRSIVELGGTLLVSISLIYSVVTTIEVDYEMWGNFGIWIVSGGMVLFLIFRFLL